MFEKAVIVGPGLIGGSLGMALRSERLARRVVGVVRRREAVDQAVAAGAADEATMDLEQAIADADLVVLAAGVETISRQAAAILPRMRKGAVLTDVGSVKGAICRSVEKAFSAKSAGIRFVGGHPLAGSERSGIKAARVNLFRGAVCVLTPTPSTDPDGSGLAAVRGMWEAVGCRVRELTPGEHDKLLAQVSHLPHVAAAGLVNAVSDEALKLAAQGFLDTTRIASGEPGLWVEICMANREALSASLAALAEELDGFARALQAGDAKALAEKLERAKARRSTGM